VKGETFLRLQQSPSFGINIRATWASSFSHDAHGLKRLPLPSADKAPKRKKDFCLVQGETLLLINGGDGIVKSQRSRDTD
jgi:hypothetical protein